MQANLDDLRAALYQYLASKNVNEVDQKTVLEHYLIAEMCGKKTHGLRKLIYDSQFFNNGNCEIKVIQKNQNSALIDCQKSIGSLAISQIIKEIVIAETLEKSIYLVSAYNFQRFGSLYPFLLEIANNDLVGIIVNNTDPFVANKNDKVSILGTNPIGICIPYSDFPIIIDMSTSKTSINNLFSSQETGVELEENTFLDKNFEFTQDPKNGKYVVPFGDYKGFNLSFFVQFLTTCFLNIPQISESKISFDVGITIICFKKDLFFSSKIVDESLKNLVSNFPRIAGKQSNINYKKCIKTNSIKILNSIYAQLF